MKKITFFAGVVVGAAATFYALPYYERSNGAIKRPGLSQIANIDIDRMIHRSSEEKASNVQLTKNVYLAMDVIKTREMDERASEHTLSVISDLADYSQPMREVISDLLSRKQIINTQDALNIFNRYLTGKG
jgi:hypothetical protein